MDSRRAVPVSGPNRGGLRGGGGEVRRLGCTSWSSLRENGRDWSTALVPSSGTCHRRSSDLQVVPSRNWQRRVRSCRDTPVAMDVLVGVGSGASARKSLHVQSVSCWAPACIGPYAQAVTHLGLTHMAGVIGMVPATLDMIHSSDGDANATEARRAWRSAAAVARASGATLASDCLSCTVYSSTAGGDGRGPRRTRPSPNHARRGWQDDVDVPGGPHAAAGCAGSSTVTAATGPGRFPATRPALARPRRRWPWDPLVTHVTCPGFGARVEVSPCYSTATGRVRAKIATNRGTATWRLRGWRLSN